ncbi:MAG: N-acetylneuraminate synthase family protein [Planctomycetota bacterium]
MKIGDREIGPECEPYVIAEIGVNHDGEVDRALMLTDAAADAGADAVKLQFFETDRLMSRAARLASYQKAAGETDPIEMLRRLELSLDEMSRVVDRAHARGVHAIVTVFSVELVDEAERLDWDAYKTASPDLVHRPLLERLEATGKPMIVSTGASHAEEVRQTRAWLDEAHDRLAFLQCVSCYPTAPEHANVRACVKLRDDVHPCPVGYSDHTTTINAGRNARMWHACLMEKHLTDDRSRAGPDHAASLTPDAFVQYIGATRIPSDELDRVGSRGVIDARLWGGFHKALQDCERDVRAVSRQSIVAVRDLPVGATIHSTDLTFKRPGTGLWASELERVVGRRVARQIEADTPIVLEDIAGLAEPVA